MRPMRWVFSMEGTAQRRAEAPTRVMKSTNPIVSACSGMKSALRPIDSNALMMHEPTMLPNAMPHAPLRVAVIEVMRKYDVMDHSIDIRST